MTGLRRHLRAGVATALAGAATVLSTAAGVAETVAQELRLTLPRRDPDADRPAEDDRGARPGPGDSLSDVTGASRPSPTAAGAPTAGTADMGHDARATGAGASVLGGSSVGATPESGIDAPGAGEPVTADVPAAPDPLAADEAVVGDPLTADAAAAGDSLLEEEATDVADAAPADATPPTDVAPRPDALLGEQGQRSETLPDAGVLPPAEPAPAKDAATPKPQVSEVGPTAGDDPEAPPPWVDDVAASVAEGTVAQATARLPELTAPQLRAVERYERSHLSRVTLLRAIDAELTKRD